jgi:hypothetical protein
MQQRRRWILSTAIMVLLVGLVFSAEAQKPAPPVSTASVGPILDIWFGDSTKDDIMPAVAYNSTLNEFLVVWVMTQDGNTWDIWARRVSANGELLSYFNVDSVVGKHLTNPAVVYNPVSNKYLVVYELEIGVFEKDLVGRIVDGSSISDLIIFENSRDNTIHASLICNTSNGDYLLAFTREKADRWEIQLMRFSSEMILQNNLTIASAADQYRYDPDVAYASVANKYLIAYTYDTASASRIRGKGFAADLSDFDSVTEQFFDGNYNGKNSPAAAGSENEFLVTWSTAGGGTTHARRVNSSGVPQASEFEIALPPVNYMWDFPDVAYTPGFGYLISYRDWLTTSTDDSDIGGRYVRPGQDTAWQTNFMIDDNINFQHSAVVACSPVKCLVVYNHNMLAYPGTEYGIRGRFVYPYSTYIPLLKNP